MAEPCKHCGAEMKWSENKKKWYCGALCFKNMPGFQEKPFTPKPQGPPQQSAPAPNKDTDWEAVNAEKQRNIHWGESFKMACQGFGGMEEKLIASDIGVIHANALNLYSRIHDRAPWKLAPAPQPTQTYVPAPEQAPPPSQEPGPGLDQTDDLPF